MANTRSSAKRARQAKRRQATNNIVRSSTKSAVKSLMDTLKTKDIEKVKEAYMGAVKALSKAASKGGIPTNRAARKVKRMTALLKKQLPDALVGGAKSAKKTTTKKSASKNA